MRELIYVPIVHTEVDMGSMSDSLRKEYLARYGKRKWQQHIKAIESMWDGLRQKIFSLNLLYRNVRIYQDGLPVCGKELEIVRDVAAQGSLNHQIVLDLVKEGAKLEGTEDPALLLQEYNNLKKLTPSPFPLPQGERISADTSKNRRSDQKGREMSEDLLIKRDKFIAERIESTLAEDEIGILFMGLRHEVNKYLRGIKISYLIHRLPFKSGTLADIEAERLIVRYSKRAEERGV